MTRTPALRGFLAGFVLLIGSVTPAVAQGPKGAKTAPPTPAQMLDPRLAPKHDDVVITTPAADELAACTVVQVFGQTPTSSGWVLLDAKKQKLRQFFDTAGRGNVDSWSYFRDGVEVYREFDTKSKGTPDNFRWLNAGGMKWGVGTVDARGKAVIHSWNMISAEEAGYEAYQAVARNDFSRLNALMVTEADLQRLKLPSAKIKATMAGQQLAQKKFADLLKEINLTGAKYDDIESAVPQADTTGDVETIKYASRAIRYVAGKEERKWLHTGELVQVGMSWKLTDVPSSKDHAQGGGEPMMPPLPAELQKLLERLTDLDKVPPPPKGVGDKDAKTHAYLHERITVIQKIIPVDKADQRESWYKQLFDNLMAMAQNNCEDSSLALIKKLSDDVEKQMPGSNLAAYGAYRFHWSTYAVETHRAGDKTDLIGKAQDKFLTNLGEFVKKFTKSEDTPEALYQLASGCEFGGKTEQSKGWYKELAESFAGHHLAPRAKGCLARLNLIGNKLELTAPLLEDQKKTFDINQLKGKVIVVHYWSSQTDQFDLDFRKLKTLLEQPSAKQNVELVNISLDETAAKAAEGVRKAAAPGIHLYQTPTNNAANPLATQYGIHILPTIFVVGQDGRVTNNALQISDVETELRKVLK